MQKEISFQNLILLVKELKRCGYKMIALGRSINLDGTLLSSQLDHISVEPYLLERKKHNYAPKLWRVVRKYMGGLCIGSSRGAYGFMCINKVYQEVYNSDDIIKRLKELHLVWLERELLKNE